MENKLVSAEQLEQVTRYARAVGIDLHEAVLQKKIAPSDAVMMAYAESVGLPFVHLANSSIDEEIASQIDPMTARQYSLIPISTDQGHVLLATAKPVAPDVVDELRMTFNLPVRCVICSPAELGVAIAKHYPRGATRVARTEQEKASPQSKPTSKKSEPVEPMNEQEIKDRFLKTFATFNFTAAAVFFVLLYLPVSGWIGNSFFAPLLPSMLVGGIVAVLVWRAWSR